MYDYPVNADETNHGPAYPLLPRGFDEERREMPGQEEQAWLRRRFWREVFVDEGLKHAPQFWEEMRLHEAVAKKDPEAMPPDLLRFAWRWSRAITRATGMLRTGTRLEEALSVRIVTEDEEESLDPWDTTLPILPRAPKRTLHRLLDQEDIIYLNPPYPASTENEDFTRWISLVKSLFNSPAVPRVIFEDPVRAGELWPTKDEILAWEEVFVAGLVAALSEGGRVRARGYLNKHDLTAGESADLMGVAEQVLLEDYGGRDIELERALLMARLDHLAERSVDALDLRTELGVLKAMAVISGVTRAEGQDAMKDVADVAREYGSSPRRLTYGDREE